MPNSKVNDWESGLKEMADRIAAIGSSRRPRVLVVDDESNERELMRRILADYQIIVDESNSGVEALRLLQENLYDVVFLDVKMPGMNGIEVHRRIAETWPKLRVFLCTWYHEFSEAADALNHGVVRIIDKSKLDAVAQQLFGRFLLCHHVTET